MTTRESLTLRPVLGGVRRPSVLIAMLVVASALIFSALVIVGGPAPAPLPATSPATEAVTETGTDGEEVLSEETSDVGPALGVTVEVFLARDPFDPVVPEPVPATDASDPSGPGPSDDPSLPGDPAAPGDPSAPGVPVTSPGTQPISPDAATCVGQTELVCNGLVVALIDVTTVDDEQTAIIQVDATVYEVTAGQRFAGFFEVRAIDGRCVSLLFGDDAFQLCHGDSVFK